MAWHGGQRSGVDKRQEQEREGNEKKKKKGRN